MSDERRIPPGWARGPNGEAIPPSRWRAMTEALEARGAPAPGTAASDDVDAINRALLQGTLGIGESGLAVAGVEAPRARMTPAQRADAERHGAVAEEGRFRARVGRFVDGMTRAVRELDALGEAPNLVARPGAGIYPRNVLRMCHCCVCLQDMGNGWCCRARGTNGLSRCGRDLECDAFDPITGPQPLGAALHDEVRWQYEEDTVRLPSRPVAARSPAVERERPVVIRLGDMVTISEQTGVRARLVKETT
jgi:hypothetical protein